MEEWRKSRYKPDIEVSSLGRVRLYIQGHLNGDGYISISGGKRNVGKLPIHVLVADAFLGPRPHGCVIRHKDDNKLNPRLDNLSYGTPKQNWEDAERNGKVIRFDPIRADRLKKLCNAGGKWWKGKKRTGQRGKAVL